MRSDPYILVTCDACGIYTDEFTLTALAMGAYDERDVDSELERYGWEVMEKEVDICPDCAMEDKDELAD